MYMGDLWIYPSRTSGKDILHIRQQYFDIIIGFQSNYVFLVLGYCLLFVVDTYGQLAAREFEIYRCLKLETETYF